MDKFPLNLRVAIRTLSIHSKLWEHNCFGSFSSTTCFQVFSLKEMLSLRIIRIFSYFQNSLLFSSF